MVGALGGYLHSLYFIDAPEVLQEWRYENGAMRNRPRQAVQRLPLDDTHLVPQPTMTLYTPFGQGPLFGGGCSCMYERTRMR